MDLLASQTLWANWDIIVLFDILGLLEASLQCKYLLVLEGFGNSSTLMTTKTQRMVTKVMFQKPSKELKNLITFENFSKLKPLGTIDCSKL